MESITNLMGLMGQALLCALTLVAVVPFAKPGTGRKHVAASAAARVATFDAPEPHPLAPTSWSRRG